MDRKWEIEIQKCNGPDWARTSDPAAWSPQDRDAQVRNRQRSQNHPLDREKTQKNVDLHFATRISDPFEQRGAPGVADSEADEHHAHSGADRAPRHRPA
jgi:hypothetical protein